MTADEPVAPDSFSLTLPAFSLVTADGKSAAFVQTDSGPLLPLWTDEDAARTFVRRAGLVGEVGLVRLSTAGAVASFLEAATGVSTQVVADPVARDQQMWVFPAAKLIALFRAAVQRERQDPPRDVDL